MMRTPDVPLKREDRINLPLILETLEKRLLLEALAATGGIKHHAAAILGINRTTLVMKMKKYDMPLLPPAQRKKRDVAC
jgi:two-component system response regulator AtoC